MLGAFLYAFLGSEPVKAVAYIHEALGWNEMISLNGLFGAGHMAAYGLLTLLLSRIFNATNSLPAIAAALFGIGVGVEVLQEEFLGRQFQLTDVVANAVGIGAAVVLLAISTRRRRRRPLRRRG